MEGERLRVYILGDLLLRPGARNVLWRLTEFSFYRRAARRNDKKRKKKKQQKTEIV